MINCDNCGQFVGKNGTVEINDDPYFIWWAFCERCSPNPGEKDHSEFPRTHQDLDDLGLEARG